MVNIFLNGGRKYNQSKYDKSKRRRLKKTKKSYKARRKKEDSVASVNPSEVKDCVKQKFKKSSFDERDKRIPIVLLGDAVFNNTMKGKNAGVSRVLRAKLKEASNNNRLVLVDVDEYLTSQVKYTMYNFCICVLLIALPFNRFAPNV
jgi:hypothetical protein